VSRRTICYEEVRQRLKSDYSEGMIGRGTRKLVERRKASDISSSLKQTYLDDERHWSATKRAVQSLRLSNALRPLTVYGKVSSEFCEFGRIGMPRSSTET
jgi:hypothetical protein